MWPFCRWTKLHSSISFILFFHMIPSNSSGNSQVSQCNILAIQIKQWARLIQRVIMQLNNFPCNSMLTPLNTLRNTDGIRNVLPIVSARPGRKKGEQVKMTPAQVLWKDCAVYWVPGSWEWSSFEQPVGLLCPCLHSYLTPTVRQSTFASTWVKDEQQQWLDLT